MCVVSLLRSGLDLGESLALLEPSLLLEAHDLETVEVGEGLAALLLQRLLCPVALLPLCVDTSGLPGLLDGTGSGATGKLLDDEWCEKGLGEGDGTAGSRKLGVGGRSIDEGLLTRKDIVLVIPASHPICSHLRTNVRACGQ